MRNINSFIIGSLIAIAIFIICNCAGYLLVSLVGPMIMGAEEQKAGLPSNNIVPTALTPVNVVTFSTPTATIPLPTPLAQLPAGAATSPPTPIPLLPTITAAPPTSTPLPTDTAIPLPTATPAPPTNTPTAPAPPPTQAKQIAAHPTADPSQLEILSHQTYVDTLGWHHIVGEVQNNSEATMEFVEVTAKLYDEASEVIGTKLTFTTPDVIFPGGKAPFDVITLRPSQWQQIKEYKLQVQGDEAKELLSQNLILLNQNSRIQDGFLYVSGEVQNTGQSPALVKLIVTLYDANLKVINTNWSYANLGIIPVNQTSPFEVKIAHSTDPNNFNYRIQIEEEVIEGDSEDTN